MSSSPLALHLRTDASAAQPLGAAAARGGNGLTSSTSASAASPVAGQGTFTAQVAVTLYDAHGDVRQLADAPASITGATLTGDETAVIDVQGVAGDGSDLTVTLAHAPAS